MVGAVCRQASDKAQGRKRRDGSGLATGRVRSMGIWLRGVAYRIGQGWRAKALGAVEARPDHGLWGGVVMMWRGRRTDFDGLSGAGLSDAMAG